jgi:hypothetical protein
MDPKSPSPQNSGSIADRLLKVKTMLQAPDAQFAAIQDEFLKIGETNKAFRTMGIEVKKLRPEEEALFQKTLAEKGKDLAKAQQRMLTRVVENGFIHGTLVYQMTEFVTVIYFTDIRVGMMSFVKFPSPKIDYVRFSAQPLTSSDEKFPQN